MRASCAILLVAAECAVAGEAIAQGGAATSTRTSSFVPPTLLHEEKPIYPPAALAQEIEGAVQLELTVDEIGRVETATVVSGPGAGLDEAALEAARKFRFSPAMENGVPVPVSIRFKYNFILPANAPAPIAVAVTSTAVQPVDPAGLVGPVGTRHPSQPIAGIDPAFTVVVRAKRPPRSASDWTFSFGVTHAAPSAGVSGAEILKKAPGVYISQHSGQGKGHQIFLRGFDAVHGQDVALSAGGIPINEVSNIHGQGYADLHFLIPETVAKMRVVEGAYDPRQGDFAVAGSIDFDLGLTRRGLFGRFSGGRFGLFRGLAAWGPEGQPEETFVAAEFARADGFGPSRAWNRASAIGQGVVPLGGGVDLRLLATTYAGRFDSPGVLRLDDFEQGEVGFFDTYGQQRGASTRHQALVELRYADESSEAALSTYAVLRSFRLRQNFTGFLLDPRGDLTEQLHDATIIGGRGHYEKRLFEDRLRVELGAVWRHDQIEQSQGRLRNVDGVLYETDADNELGITDVGLYADFNLVIVDGLHVRGGARIEALSFLIDEQLAGTPRREALGFKVAPKATIDWKAVDQLRFFLSYGNGFRSPQAVSLGQGEQSPFTEVHSGELGGRLELGRFLRTTVTGFVTYVEEDLIFDHATGQNVFDGPTLRGGGQILLESSPLPFLHATVAATYTRATKPETGDVVPFVPPFVLRFDVDGHEHVTDLFGSPLGVFASFGGSWLPPRPLPFSEESEPILVLETAVGLEYDRFALSVEIYNLLDARYRDAEFVYASDFEQGAGTSMVPARHFTAGRPFTAQATLTVNY